jgi:hypothetical protein
MKKNTHIKYLIIMAWFITTHLCAIDFSYTNNPYGTHQPILYAIASNTTGPIIELGCGYGSTDLLHEVCKQTGRVLVTLEDDQEWLNQFKAKYKNDGYVDDNSGWHKMYFVPGKKENPDRESPAHWVSFFETTGILRSLNFEVCFIDQSPWLARYESIKRVKNLVRYVILHDCDYFPGQGIFGKIIRPIDKRNSIPGVFDFSDVFQHAKVYFPVKPWPGQTGPPTLVGSNVDADFLRVVGE